MSEPTQLWVAREQIHAGQYLMIDTKTGEYRLTGPTDRQRVGIAVDDIAEGEVYIFEPLTGIARKAQQ